MAETIICDTRQKHTHHTEKEKYFKAIGLKILNSKLPVGDYANMKDWSVIVDTKKDIQEVIGNICGKEHERFRRECELARDNNIQLIILIADDNVKKIDDLYKWKNPRRYIKVMKTMPNGKKEKVLKYPNATPGATLARAMRTMEYKYGVQFKFCPAKYQGYGVCRLLGLKGDRK